MGIAALAFASCAKDTVKETNNGFAIDFRVATQTRATEVTTNTLNQFNVTAISATDAGAESTNYFTDVTFAKTGNETFFFSDPAYYWPNEGKLKFYAWAPVGLAGVSINSTAKAVSDFTPAAEVYSQQDFVVALAEGSKANEGTGVALTFNHMLSQIQIKAKNAHTGYTYTVKAVKVSGVIGKADFDFSESEWDLSEQTADYTVTFAAPVVLDPDGDYMLPANTVKDEATVSSGSMMLIPQNLDDVAANAAIELYVNVVSDGGSKVFPETGDEYGWMSIPVDTEWLAGHKYLYTLDLTKGSVLGEPIKFRTEVTAWPAEEGVNVPEEEDAPAEEPGNEEPEPTQGN